MGVFLEAKSLAVCPVEWSGCRRRVHMWAEAIRRKAMGQGHPELLSIILASWMHFALKGLCFDSYPLPNLGRSWPSRSCRNSWCSRRPCEYLPPDPVSVPRPLGVRESALPLSLALWALVLAPSLPFGSRGGRRDEK